MDDTFCDTLNDRLAARGAIKQLVGSSKTPDRTGVTRRESLVSLGS